MARQKLKDRNVRKINKYGNGSYSLTIPIEMMRELGWRDGQKVVFKRKGRDIVIKDWKR